MDELSIDIIKNLIIEKIDWVDLDFLFAKTHLSFDMLRKRCNVLVARDVIQREKRGTKMYYKAKEY
jgi:hypothetical protein